MRCSWLLIVVAVACGKSSKSGNAPAADKPEPVAAGSAAPAPAPAAGGPLTADKVMGSSHVLQAFEPWDEALAKMQAALGPPSRIKHDAVTNSDAYEWAAMDGDDCAFVSIGKMDGKPMGKPGDVAPMAMPMRFKNDGKDAAQRAECVAAAKGQK